MLTKTQQIIAALAIVCGAVLISVLLFQNRPVSESTPPPPTSLLVDVAVAVPQTVNVELHSRGTVMPATQTQLVSEVAGSVVTVSDKFHAGGLFEAGEIILKLDDRNYQSQLKRQQAAVASARSQLALEKGRAEVAYQDWKRYQGNVERSNEAEQLALRKPQLQEAQARLDAALADLEQAKIDLSRTVIRAPYRGLIAAKQVAVGQYVGPGTPLLSISDVSKAEVRLPIPDDQLPYLDLKQDVAVTLLHQQDRLEQHWAAVIRRNEGVLDADRRVLFLVAEVEDPYGLNHPHPPLRFGYFVSAQIEGRAVDNVVMVPRHLLRTGNKLWISDAEGRLRNRKVELLRSSGEFALVNAGLKAGDQIVLSTIPSAVAGTSVRINQTLDTQTLARQRQADDPGRAADSEAAANTQSEPMG